MIDTIKKTDTLINDTLKIANDITNQSQFTDFQHLYIIDLCSFLFTILIGLSCYYFVIKQIKKYFNK